MKNFMLSIFLVIIISLEAQAGIATRSLFPSASLASISPNMDVGTSVFSGRILQRSGSKLHKLNDYDTEGKILKGSLLTSTKFGYLQLMLDKNEYSYQRAVNENKTFKDHTRVNNYVFGYLYDFKEFSLGFDLVNYTVNNEYGYYLSNNYIYSDGSTSHTSASSFSINEIILRGGYNLTKELNIGLQYTPGVTKEYLDKGYWGSTVEKAGYGSEIRLGMGYHSDDYVLGVDLLSRSQNSQALSSAKKSIQIQGEYLIQPKALLEAGFSRLQSDELQVDGVTENVAYGLTSYFLKASYDLESFIINLTYSHQNRKYEEGTSSNAIEELKLTWTGIGITGRF